MTFLGIFDLLGAGGIDGWISDSLGVPQWVPVPDIGWVKHHDMTSTLMSPFLPIGLM